MFFSFWLHTSFSDCILKNVFLHFLATQSPSSCAFSDTAGRGLGTASVCGLPQASLLPQGSDRPLLALPPSPLLWGRAVPPGFPFHFRYLTLSPGIFKTSVSLGRGMKCGIPGSLAFGSPVCRPSRSSCLPALPGAGGLQPRLPFPASHTASSCADLVGGWPAPAVSLWMRSLVPLDTAVSPLSLSTTRLSLGHST